MKKRTALVSYSNCDVVQYSVKSDTNSTQLSDARGTVATIKEQVGTFGIEARIGGDTIRLSAEEAELLLTALLAHQRLQEGYNLELYRKG